jgi:hypothetical protein
MGDRRLSLVVVLAAALGLAATAASAPATRLATFRPAHGWLVVRAGPGNPSLVVAVPARDAAAVHPVALFSSLRKLARDGILVWVDTIGRGRRDFPAAPVWPPQLTGFRVDHGWEGQPAANVEQRTWVGSRNRWDLDVRVFFGTQHPTSALLARAQAELGRLRLP